MVGIALGSRAYRLFVKRAIADLLTGWLAALFLSTYLSPKRGGNVSW